MALAGKKVLVTGGSGFLGAHLVQSLLLQGANVVVTYLDKTPSSYFFYNKLDKKVVLFPCDLKDFESVRDLIFRQEVDYVFHLAAQAIVTTSYKNPIETYQSNVMGTVNILEACRLYGLVSGVVVSSSDKAYGKLPRVKESDPIGGTHPYESSKAAADLIAQTYFATYDLPVVITRFGNTYGEGDLNFSRIIPGIMDSVINRKTFEVRSNGKYVRDYVYVGDIISALILLARNIKKVRGEAFNVSSSENLSVIELIKIVSQILDKKIEYKILNSAVNEIPVQSVNYNKIKQTLGWRPRNNLNSTIASIFTWYREYFENHSYPRNLIVK